MVEHAAEELERFVRARLDSEVQKEGKFEFVRELRGVWSPKLVDAAIDVLRKGTLGPEAYGSLLRELLEVRSSDAFADGAARATNAAEERGRRAIALRELLHSQGSRGWHVVWPVLEGDTSLAREVIESLAQLEHNATFSEGLTSAEAGVLLAWLMREYPPGSDSEPMGFISPAQAAGMMRDALLRRLQAGGTKESFDALLAATKDMPDGPVKSHYLLPALELTIANTWLPPSPSQVRSMAEEESRRLVRSSKELQLVVLDALIEVQQGLSGATAEIELLWDEQRSVTGAHNKAAERYFVPKDEAALSDYVKRRLEHVLRERRLVINREVEVSRGSELDITVEAISSDSYQERVARVVIETKGCWNKDLETAMENQLAKRYLKPGHCRHGIYLVGWYLCDRWLPASHHRKSTPNWTVEEARRTFALQADGLSIGGQAIAAFILDLRLPVS